MVNSFWKHKSCVGFRSIFAHLHHVKTWFERETVIAFCSLPFFFLYFDRNSSSLARWLACSRALLYTRFPYWLHHSLTRSHQNASASSELEFSVVHGRGLSACIYHTYTYRASSLNCCWKQKREFPTPSYRSIFTLSLSLSLVLRFLVPASSTRRLKLLLRTYSVQAAKRVTSVIYLNFFVNLHQSQKIFIWECTVVSFSFRVSVKSPQPSDTSDLCWQNQV